MTLMGVLPGWSQTGEPGKNDWLDDCKNYLDYISNDPKHLLKYWSQLLDDWDHSVCDDADDFSEDRHDNLGDFGDGATDDGEYFVPDLLQSVEDRHERLADCADEGDEHSNQLVDCCAESLVILVKPDEYSVSSPISPRMMPTDPSRSERPSDARNSALSPFIIRVRIPTFLPSGTPPAAPADAAVVASPALPAPPKHAHSPRIAATMALPSAVSPADFVRRLGGLPPTDAEASRAAAVAAWPGSHYRAYAPTRGLMRPDELESVAQEYLASRSRTHRAREMLSPSYGYSQRSSEILE